MAPNHFHLEEVWLMRNYSKLSPFFWLKGSGKRLRGDALAQVVAAHLSTCPEANMVGIFFVSIAAIANNTGHSADDVRAALVRVSEAGYAHYDLDAELVWIPNHAYFEIGRAMKPGDKRRGKVLAELAQVAGHRFVDEFRKQYGVAFCISANDFGDHEPASRMGHPAVEEGASAILGQDKHRTGQTQDRIRGIGASAPDPEEPDRVFKVGTASAHEAREVFTAAVAKATGAPFALSRASFHTQELCDALNAHAPPDLATKPEILRWLPTIASLWYRASAPKVITPAKMLEWLNAGRPDMSQPQRRGPGGGPRGDRQGLDGWRPPVRTGTDDDPFGGDS